MSYFFLCYLFHVLVYYSLKEHEILIWLIGLISTDGSVREQTHKAGYTLMVFSKEKNWIKRIKTVLSTIDIETSIWTRNRKTSFGIAIMNCLYLQNPRKIFGLFQKYSDLEQFCNPRKWQIIQKAILYYKKALPHWRFTDDDIKFINEHYKSMTDKEIAEALGKKLLSADSIKQKRLKLGIWKRPQSIGLARKWTLEEERFLAENFDKLTDVKLGKKVNRSRLAILQKRNRMKLIKPKERNWSRKEEQFLRENYLKMSDVELAKKLGRARTTVCSKRIRMNLLKSR